MSEALVPATRTHELDTTINRLVDEISASIFEQNRKFIRLASALLEMQVNGYWRNLGFASWNGYLGSLKDRVNKNRTQLYGYVQVAAALLPCMTEAKLEDIGITKGLILAKGMRISKLRPSQHLIDYAANPKNTTEEVEAEMNREFKIHQPTDTAKWFEIGFYATEDQILELKQAAETAKRTDPVTSHTLSESAQWLDVLLKWAEEYEGTYAALAEEGKA